MCMNHRPTSATRPTASLKCRCFSNRIPNPGMNQETQRHPPTQPTNLALRWVLRLQRTMMFVGAPAGTGWDWHLPRSCCCGIFGMFIFLISDSIGEFRSSWQKLCGTKEFTSDFSEDQVDEISSHDGSQGDAPHIYSLGQKKVLSLDSTSFSV